MKKLLFSLVLLMLTLHLAADPLLEGSPVQARDQTPGLVVFGYVRTADGKGVSGVRIHRSLVFPWPNPVTTTDQDGFYWTPFQYIPGDEMIYVFAERGCYSFDPDRVVWRHYSGYVERRVDFTAYPAACQYLPFIQQGSILQSTGRSPAR